MRWVVLFLFSMAMLVTAGAGFNYAGDISHDLNMMFLFPAVGIWVVAAVFGGAAVWQWAGDAR
jgi:hypothetical protein